MISYGVLLPEAKPGGEEGEMEEEPLPYEIMSEHILPRARTVDLVRLRPVCKWWNRLTNSPRFIHKHQIMNHRTLLKEDHNFPSVAGDDNRPKVRIIATNPELNGGDNYSTSINIYELSLGVGEDQTVGSAPVNDEIRVRKRVLNSCWPEAPARYTILPPCNGLVVIIDIDDGIHLCNPATGEFTDLPQPMPRSDQEGDCCYGLGFDSIKNEFKLVRIYSYGTDGPNSGCYLYQVQTLARNSSWRSVGSTSWEVFPFRKFGRREVGIHVNGRLHWRGLSTSDQGGDVIAVFDIGSEELRLKSHPPCYQEKDYYFVDLKEFDGCLTVIDMDFYEEDNVVDLWVLREYESDEWIKELHIFFGDIPAGLFEIPHALWKDEILLMCWEGTTSFVVVYNPKLESIRRVALSGENVVFNYQEGWFLYNVNDQYHVPPLFVSALID